MTIELNLTNLIFILIASFSGIWALLKSLAVQHERGMDKRFALLNEGMQKNHEVTRNLERDLLLMQSELPRVYLRREDYLREMQALTESIQRELTPMRKSVVRIEDFLINKQL